MAKTPNKLLRVDSIAQEKVMWCWAACSEMVLTYLRRPGDLSVVLGRGSVAMDTPVPSQGQFVDMRRGSDGKPLIDCSIPPGANATNAEEDEWYRVCNWGGWPNLMEFNQLVETTTWASRRYVLEERGLRLEKDGPRMRTHRPLTDSEIEYLGKRGFRREKGTASMLINRPISKREMAYLRRHGLRLEQDGARTRVHRSLSYDELRHLVGRGGPEFRRALDAAEDCALSWEALKQQIDDGSPVIFSWRDQESSSGHLMVASGYLSIPQPGAAKAEDWVFVRDSWPPLGGDGYLIPYDYYVNGPDGRHWRDYWVPKTGGSPYSMPWKKAFAPSRGVRVSHVSKSEAKDSKKPTWSLEALEGIVAESARAAKPEVTRGLEGLRAIVAGEDALDMALALGLGVIWMKAIASLVPDFLGTVLSTLGESEGDGESETASGDFFEDVDASRYLGPRGDGHELVLFDEEPAIPVFQISRADLEKWDGNAERLPLAQSPNELVFPVRWPGQKPFELFSTITVRRQDDDWKVVSIGRSSIIQALGMKRWAAARDLGNPDWMFKEGGLEKLRGILEDLGLVDAAGRSEGIVERVLDVSSDLGLRKVVWRGAARLVAMKDRLERLLEDRIRASIDPETGPAEEGQETEVAELLALLKKGSLDEWREALLEGTSTSNLSKGLEVDPEYLKKLLFVNKGSSVLDRLWPIALAESSALETRPDEPTLGDWDSLMALARALDQLLECSKPPLLIARIDKRLQESGADSDEVAQTERLDALAQAADGGWQFLERRARELEKPGEGLNAALADLKNGKKSAEDSVLEALSADEGSKKPVILTGVIEAVQKAWKKLDEAEHSRVPKPSLANWRLPKYLIQVPEFYQLFIVYAEDDIQQAYSEEFYSRPHRVRATERVDLLRQLKKLA